MYFLSVCLSIQDVRVLYSQMAGREVDEPDAPIETSLDHILAYIRSHWEKVTERNRAETDSYQLECRVGMTHLHRCPHKPGCFFKLCLTCGCMFAAGGTMHEQQTES